MTSDKATSKRERLKAHLPQLMRSPRRTTTPAKVSPGDDSLSVASAVSLQPGTGNPKSVWEEAWASLESEEPSLLQKYQQYLLDEGNVNAKLKASQVSGKEKVDQLLRTVDNKVTVARNKLQDDSFSSKVHRFFDETIDYLLKGSEFVKALASSEPHAALVWAGVSVMLPFLLNPNIERDAALEGLVNTSRILVRYTVIESDMFNVSRNGALSDAEASKLQEQLRKYLIALYSKIIRFQIQLVLRYERATVMQYFRDVVQVDDWQLMVTEIKELEESNLKDINILGHHILLHVQSIIEQQDRQVSAGFADMVKRFDSLEAGIKTIRAENKTNQDASVDTDCMNAFKIDTNYVLQKDRNTTCAPDTGQWFFHHSEYQAFRDGRGLRMLFVTAEAGGGKSTIMRTFVDRLQESYDRPIVAYFFFKDDDDQLRSYEDALSSIIYQLFVQERGLIRHARNIYKRYGHGIRYQTKEMWSILMKIATEADREIVCVLDAVDECTPAGRRQLVSDLVTAFYDASQPTSTRLRIVVTSRPYQDENHPYADLVVSDTIQHLAGENAIVESDIQAVIRFKAEELAKKRQLSQSTLDILIEKISSQNRQTRSFLAVRMAFELLDSHHMMHKGARERTIRMILADIPRSLGDQFDEMLNRSIDKEHARRLFCVILASRKTLKIPEFKVLYVLTQPANNAVGPPQSYDDLELPTDDEDFKQFIRARCGLFITFVRNSVHLFHQTAREHLVANIDTTSSIPLGGTSKFSTSGQLAPHNTDRQYSWRGCITEADANLVVLTVCLDLFLFNTPKSWVLNVFDSLNAGNEFFRDIKTLLEDKPLLQYAAFNWYEHAVLGGDSALAALRTARYAVVLDVSKTSFWVWYLVLADYMCTSHAHPVSLLSSVWGDDCKKHRLSHEYGVVLRELCLGKLFEMDYKLHNLINDPSLPLSEAMPSVKGPVWTAEEGYELIDRYHVAYGDHQYTSFSRAVQCIERGQEERGKFLSTDIPIPTMIWTCISDAAPIALQNSLAAVKGIEWLNEVPEHLMYRRSVWHGSSSRSGEDLRKERAMGWTAPCPPAFAAASRAIAFNTGIQLFSVLADWMERSDNPKDYAEKLWEAGGFVEPSFCRRLVDAGAFIDAQLWTGRRTALQITAALWEHDAVHTLIKLGADPAAQKSNERTALHWFLCGPKTVIKDERGRFSLNTKAAFARLGAREQQRYRKSRITSSLKVLCRAQSTHVSPLDQTDSSGKYPLMLAVRNSPTATKALLDEGANIKQRDRWGRTAIMHFYCGAFNGRPPAILKHLMDAGADSSACDTSGHTVLHYWTRQLLAIDMGSLYPGFNSYNKGFDILTGTGPLSEMDILVRELTPLKIPLSAAARLGNARLCLALLKSGANPNKHGLTTNTRLPENNGTVAGDLANLSWKPLMIAINQQAYTIAAIFLAHGADVTFKTPTKKRTKYNKYDIKKCGTTALHLAVGSTIGYSGYSISLHSGGLSVGCSFRAVGNPEHKVSNKAPRHALVKMQKRRYQQTPSYKKKFKDESSDSEYEIRMSKSTNDWTGEKLLPYDKVTETMLASMNLDDPLYQIIIDKQQTDAVRQEALVELLLKKGAPVNAKTQEGITPLACVDGSSPDLARLLLQYGADPNTASADGCTPLTRAAQRGHRELAEVLLTAGANPDVQLQVGPLEKRQCSAFIERSTSTFNLCDAPLTALAAATESGHYEIVELLLKNGADPNLPIVHHAHGRLPSKRDQRRRGRSYGESDSSDSETEPEQWMGYISTGTALSWARDEVRELLLRNGADPEKEEPLRECDCAVIEKRKERGWYDSEDEWPAHSGSEGSDAELRRHRYKRGMVVWEGDTEDSD